MMTTERLMAYAVVLIILLIFIAVYLKSWIRCVLLAFKLHGPPVVPFLGNVLLIGDSDRLFQVGLTCYQDFGRIFRAWISIIPIIFVVDPRDVQVILGSSKHTEKNFVYALMHNFIGKGLISNSGEKWKTHRKWIQPYFHINILELYTNTFWQSSSRQIQKLKGVKEVNITKFVNDSVLDILHEAVLGIGPHETTLKAESPYRKGEMTAPIRIQKPWYLLDYLYRFTTLAEKEVKQRSKLYEFTKKVLNDRRNSTVPPVTVSLMQYFIEISESNPSFDDDSIINELSTFMLAGQDSVAAGVSFSLYCLAGNQSVQDKAYAELESIFNNSDRSADFNDLRNMKYLEQCIKEALRLYPSVPMVSRKLLEDVVLGDVTLPAGCNVFIAPFVTHQLPHVYENPTEFNPDRFSKENIDKLHPFAYLPFSAGPRNCIGYKFALIEMKMIVSTLLRNYHISLSSNNKVKLAYRITLRASGGIWLRLEPRKSI